MAVGVPSWRRPLKKVSLENDDKENEDPAEHASDDAASPFSQSSYSTPDDNDDDGGYKSYSFRDSTVDPVSPSSTLGSSDRFGQGSSVLPAMEFLEQQEGLGIDVPPSDEDTPNVRNDSAESSNRRSKRKAEIIEDVEQDTGHNGVAGTSSCVRGSPS
ncbi:hypothetical protein B0O80DRAFT_492424 [Mortierella sp. GBAus27b]|nr:hypothetical protein B0O80DRAFT_492424 [Mortierella sp. GBAus27b]